MSFENHLIIASANKKKLEELTKLFRDSKITFSLASDHLNDFDPLEDAKSFRGNAQIKARALKEALKLNKNSPTLVVSDDSGICVDSLDGAPGIYSKRFSEPEASDVKNNLKLLQTLKNKGCSAKEARRAHYHCCLCLWHKDQYFYFENDWQGFIAEDISKSQAGFGYDPLFIAEGEIKTVSDSLETDLAYKENRSHRAKATQQLKKFLSAELDL